MWIFKWQLVITCLSNVVTTWSMCKNTIDKLDLSTVRKIKTVLSNVHKSGRDKACDSKLVSDFIMKVYDVNHFVPYVIEKSDEIIHSEDDDKLNITGEGKIIFLPEISFIRNQNYSVSLWSLRSNFEEGKMNG